MTTPVSATRPTAATSTRPRSVTPPSPSTRPTSRPTRRPSRQHYSVANDTPPVSNAGPDQTGKKTGNVVTLNGALSSDVNTGDSLTYEWTQVVRATRSRFAGPTTTAPTFTVPAGSRLHVSALARLRPEGHRQLRRCRRTTRSRSLSAPRPRRSRPSPGARAAPCSRGDTVTLLGDHHTTPTAARLDYTSWSQATGRTTSLSSTTAANPTFIVPRAVQPRPRPRAPAAPRRRRRPVRTAHGSRSW